MATAIAIALVTYLARGTVVPAVLGIAGMVTLFYGCVLLLRETRLALRAVDSETAFVLELNEMYRRESVSGSNSGSGSGSGRSSV